MLSALLNWQVIFLVIVHVHESPHEPLRLLPEKIIPILNKNIIIAKTKTVRNIVAISAINLNQI